LRWFPWRAVGKVPRQVIKTALRATRLIGAGLYGVDHKQLPDGRVVVMEVNDNPNIDHGVEDAFLGDELYRSILSEFLERLNRR
jgi:glutathione synthase/RimK-type ligase-like ATP-grasp enzyme